MQHAIIVFAFLLSFFSQNRAFEAISKLTLIKSLCFLASPQTSFRVRLSRIKRTPKDVCGEAICFFFCGNCVSSKVNHRKKNEIFHLSDYVVNKLTARSKDLISSYINLNVGVVGSLFVMRGKQKRPMLTATTLPTRSRD